MIGHQSQNSDFAALLEAKEKELLLIQNEVLRFIDIKHDTEGTQKYMKAMRGVEIELNDLLLSLLEPKNVSTEFKKEAKALCERGSKLKDYIRDTNKALELDLKQIKGKEFDAIKIGSFAAAFPVMLVAAAKNLLGESEISNGKLTVAGILLGTVIACHKKIKPAWKAANNVVCKSSHYIKRRLKDHDVKEKRKAIGKDFQKIATMIVQRTSGAAKRGKAFVESLQNKKPPTP